MRRAYFHEEMDRPAVYTRTGYPANDPTYNKVKALFAQYGDLKLGWNGRQFESQIEVQHWTEPYSEDFERRITVLPTPKGELRSTRLVSLHGHPGLDETYFIKNREDAEKYLSLPMPELGPVDRSGYDALWAEIGDAGIVEASIGQNPGGTVAGLCGSDAFAIMSLTDRDIIHALLERHMQIMMNSVKALLAAGIGPYFSLQGQEYIVPPLHGPKDFYDFNVRYDKPIMDLIHDAGGRIHVHCHASIKKVIQGFIDEGVNVLHPFEAPPMGDITPREAKEFARGKLTLEGNIQIARMYEASPDEIRAEVEALIRDTFDDHRGLIVSPTASPYIPGEGEKCYPQYKAMVDTVLSWKG
ncbi:MAG: uroporphyrinogen decarboxylase family protein [Anaerolineae bacterium]